MYKNLSSVFQALVDGGEYHVIIGDNDIKNVPVPTHQLIAEMALKIGFLWPIYYKYPIKDHRTSIPRNGKGGKIEHEFVLGLKKP